MSSLCLGLFVSASSGFLHPWRQREEKKRITQYIGTYVYTVYIQYVGKCAVYKPRHQRCWWAIMKGKIFLIGVSKQDLNVLINSYVGTVATSQVEDIVNWVSFCIKIKVFSFFKTKNILKIISEKRKSQTQQTPIPNPFKIRRCKLNSYATLYYMLENQILPPLRLRASCVLDRERCELRWLTTSTLLSKLHCSGSHSFSTKKYEALQSQTTDLLPWNIKDFLKNGSLEEQNFRKLNM